MVERNPGLGGYNTSFNIPRSPNRYDISRNLRMGRPSIPGGTGSMIGESPRNQYEQMVTSPQYNRNLWNRSTTPTGPGGVDLSVRGERLRERSRQPRMPAMPGMPGMGGQGGAPMTLETPGGQSFRGGNMFDVSVTDDGGFSYSQRMDPVWGQVYDAALQYETSRLKFGSDERVNEAQLSGAMDRAKLEADVSREKMGLEERLAGTRDELERYDIAQQMTRLEYQAGEARFQQSEQLASDMEMLQFREAGETERARLPWEYKKEMRGQFMPLLDRLLGGSGAFGGGGGGGMGGGGFGDGGMMAGSVGPNASSNLPSFEGVFRRGVNDLIGNTMANRDAAMLSGTASQTGPEGGLGGETTANYLGPLAQHTAATSMTGGINELLQNLLQYNLGSRQATSQTLGALSPYLT